jgi:hypothetical protein
VHGGAERHAEDALAAARADELREGAVAAAVLGHGALEGHGALADAVLVVVVRRVVAVHPRGGVAERVGEGVGRRKDVLVVEAVVAQRGAARGRDVPRQRLAVGDPAALVAPRHRRGHLPRSLLVRLHSDRSMESSFSGFGRVGAGGIMQEEETVKTEREKSAASSAREGRGPGVGTGENKFSACLHLFIYFNIKSIFNHNFLKSI